MAKNCKTPEQIAAEQAAKLADMEAEIDRLNAEFRRMREEDDNTDIRIAPIEVTDDQSTVKLIGLYFNRKEIRDEDEPESGLTIEREVLDRSSRYVFGRFEYDTSARAELVYRVYLDGKFVAEQRTNLPYGTFKGNYDTVLFKYPNGARWNKTGNHLLHVEYWLYTGITESQLGLLDTGTPRSVDEADFYIKLLPYKTPRD